MDKYLKMADVFPVEIRTDDESGSLICDGDGVILESFSGDKVADYTLHAINSHDELVQMLAVMAELVGKMNCYCHQAGASANKNSENPVESWMAEADEALDAIRSA